MSREFEGRVALVTGGAKGIGRACCLKLAEGGAAVAINYRTSEQRAKETEAGVRDRGANGLAIQADVSEPEHVEQMVARVEADLGPIDLLVNNAGVLDRVPHDRLSLDLWRRALDQNLTSAYLVTWAVKPGMMRRRFGRIVNVASVAGMRPRPMAIAYAVSKAGLISLTQGLSEAVARENIRVNAVAPGLIATEMLESVDPTRLDGLLERSPLPRLGTPEEIAELVAFLLSERSSFTTGQTYVASGGRVLLP